MKCQSPVLALIFVLIHTGVKGMWYVLDREEHETKKEGASGRKQGTKDLGVKKHKRQESQRDGR